MLGPWYVDTDARRRQAWGEPCKPDLAPIVIDGKTYQCDRSVVPCFQRLEQIRAKWDFHQNGTDTGFYNCRRMRFDPTLPFSVHAWARALDWDWLQNPAGNKLITNMPKGMIQELQQVKTMSGAFVFTWGGDWDRNPATGHTYYDAMHWEVVCHPLDLVTGIAGSDEEEMTLTQARIELATAWHAVSGQWMTAQPNETAQDRLSRLAKEVADKKRTVAEIVKYAPPKAGPTPADEKVPAWVLDATIPA